jgi:hypothetical protein
MCCEKKVREIKFVTEFSIQLQPERQPADEKKGGGGVAQTVPPPSGYLLLAGNPFG